MNTYFEFKQSDYDKDRFVIELVDENKIKHARKILSGEETRQIHVGGIIVKNNASYNGQWSYHLAPESINFFENATEVCDAHMRYVEENLNNVGDSFLPGNAWCPWSSELTREIFP